MQNVLKKHQQNFLIKNTLHKRQQGYPMKYEKLQENPGKGGYKYWVLPYKNYNTILHKNQSNLHYYSMCWKAQNPNMFYLVPFLSLLLNLEESRRQIITCFIKQTQQLSSAVNSVNKGQEHISLQYMNHWKDKLQDQSHTHKTHTHSFSDAE